MPLLPEAGTHVCKGFPFCPICRRYVLSRVRLTLIVVLVITVIMLALKQVLG